jgi:nitroimidazol reductase NimA-like FMN-containing flavoprotein (pyridoxamine 5'-phosphate oxidase superfamily)
VPIYFAYHHDYLYGFSTAGQKIEWMRGNPLVCVEVDEVVSSQKWVSVIAFGRYEELPNAPEYQPAREFAWKLLQQYAMWWEPGYAKTLLKGIERPLEPIFYRISLTRISGHRAILESAARFGIEPSMTDAAEAGWLQRILCVLRKNYRRDLKHARLRPIRRAETKTIRDTVDDEMLPPLAERLGQFVSLLGSQFTI